MPKFILIDNSIADTTGHHYQYALFCLKAAKDAGYEPILATNKKNKKFENQPWKIIPAYTSTFWEHDSYNSFLTNIYRKFENSKYKIPLSLLLRIFGNFLVKKLLDKRKIEEFSKNTEELFKSFSTSENDIVFLPTSGLVEMFGISDFVKNNKITMPSWHFLFRRNIYSGSMEEYSYIYIKLRLLKLAFENFFSNSTIRAFFYTDTEELTKEYNSIGTIEFSTLPIPHTSKPVTNYSINQKLTITYLGDARNEKGYHMLPNIIQDLWIDYVITEKVNFVIQSNYNIPSGEPAAVVSRNQLQLFPKDKVKVVTESLDNDEYEKLLKKSDIILLPYKKANYFSRSSGILVEALAYGIPVLVPSKTWLSRQFTKEVYEYNRSLREKTQIVKSYDSSNLDFRYQNLKKVDFNKYPETLTWKKPQIHSWIRLNKPASHALVTVYFGKENNSSLIKIHETQLTNDKLFVKQNSQFLEKTELPYVSTLVPLDKFTEKLWIGISYPYSLGMVSISDVKVDLLKMDKSTPQSVVGQIYYDHAEISDRLCDIIENYSFYKETAIKFAQNYYKTHNADSLMKKLIEKSKQGT